MAKKPTPTKKKRKAPALKLISEPITFCLRGYDYTQSIQFCHDLGLVWLGEDILKPVAEEALALNFTQVQFDAAMRHHLWQVKWLFTPKSYSIKGRILLALHFLFGKSTQ